MVIVSAVSVSLPAHERFAFKEEGFLVYVEKRQEGLIPIVVREHTGISDGDLRIGGDEPAGLHEYWFSFELSYKHSNLLEKNNLFHGVMLHSRHILVNDTGNKPR